MRYLVCLIAGLVFGAIAASTAINAVAQRHAWQRGLMNVMQHDLIDSRSAAHDGQCQTASMQAASARVALLAGEIERAMLAPGTKDRVFSQYASDLRSVVAKWNPATAACTEQAAALTEIAHACDACHRDYR